jgi:hypothetical protein
MDIPLLIALNLFSVPFLQEAEILGRSTGRFPTVLGIIRLRHVAASSWFKPFCMIAALFVATVLLASMTSDSAMDVAILTFNFFVMQAVLWASVAVNVLRHCGDQATEHDMAESASAPPLPCVTPAVQIPHSL